MQYRVRWYPQYQFADPRWTLNGFLSTGDNFAGSHNTFYPDDQNNFYIRRAFLRYESGSRTTEAGVIPTFKGRVSSSGLSKNGFIQGVRNVMRPSKRAKLEVVLGSLNDADAKRAFRLPDKLDYIEVELSTDLTATSGYEVSLERMTGSNYLRTEYRFKWIPETEVFIEWIKRIDNLDDKIVLGTDAAFQIAGLPVEMHGYYTYVSDGVGPRAELTEDFISTGHGISIELETPLEQGWAGFMRFDAFKDNTRLIFGVEFKL